MKKGKKLWLTASAGLLAGALTLPAMAATDDEINQLKQQIEELNQKVEALQAQQQAQQAQQATSAQTASNLQPSNGVKVKIGGYIDATTIDRSANEVTDLTSVWNAKGFSTTAGAGIPFPNTPQAQTSEYRETARGSRISLLATGNPDDKNALAGYIESDFLGAAQTANSQQTNSYTPRLRQGYATWDQSEWGLHVLVGQAWSLATAFKDGLVPRDENIPITIDSGYIPGFNYTRNPQLRIAKDFDKKIWLGLSLESPQALVGGIAPSYLANPAAFSNVATTGTAFTAVPTITTVVTELGESNLNNANAYTTDSRPDVILKAAADPGWGHYELYGIYRWFTDRTNDPSLGTQATATTGAGINTTTTGEGVGGSVLLPVVPKILDLQASFLTGRGIGRYGASQLPDVTYNLNGTLAAIPETDFLFGATLHPTSAWDIFGYYGKEFVQQTAFQSNGFGNPFIYGNQPGIPAGLGAGPSANYFPATITTFSGYGLPILDNFACFVNPAETAAVTATSNCEAQTSAVQQWTLGTWWRFYKGVYGTVQAGASFSHTDVSTFAGRGGAPNPDLNVYMVSFRYYPYQ